MAFVSLSAQRTCSLGVLTAALVLLSAPAVRSEGECTEQLLYESRDEIPLRFRWNPADIFEDEEAFESAVSDVEAAIPVVERRKGTLGNSAEALVVALNDIYELTFKADMVTFYAELQLDTSDSDPAADARFAVASTLWERVAEASSFLSSEIAGLPPSRLKALLADPRTEPYRQFINDEARMKTHRRSPEVERTLVGANQLKEGPQDITDELLNSDIYWPTVVDKDGEEVQAKPDAWDIFSRSPDRDFRREGRQAVLGTLDAFGNTLSTALATLAKGEAWVTEVRGYNSSLQRVLDEENIPVEVVRSLVDAVHDNFDAVHSYTALRREALGVETLYGYDMGVAMVPDGDEWYCFEEAWALALTFWREVFGEEYATVAEAAIENRWMDVFTSTGKTSGSYASSAYGNHPYMLLNWAGTVDDVLTLVHEMGHVVHWNLTDTHQPFQNTFTPFLVEETAAMTSTILFMEWTLQSSETAEDRAFVLSHAVNLAVSNFVDVVLQHEFEEAMYSEAENGRRLTKEKMSAKFLDLQRAYYGPDLTLNATDGISFLRIQELYDNYDIWVSAASYAAGEAIASRFRDGDQGAVDDFVAMLKLGSSFDSMETLRVAGADLQDPSVIGAAMAHFQDLIEQLEVEMEESFLF